MSTPTPETPNSAATPSPKEIRIYSHSGLFYWWPVWVFGFFFALWTLVENNRLAIVSHDAVMVKSALEEDGKAAVRTRIYDQGQQFLMGPTTTPAEAKDKDKHKDLAVPEKADVLKIRPRVSAASWMGPLYLVILCMVIVITNVPLRGLWSLVVVIGSVTAALFISLFHWWDNIFDALYGLHIYINLAGYLFVSTFLCIGWFVAVFIFDKRAYIIFTPGQIKVCEQVGGREKVYDTTGMTIEKHRDDWFRHIFLGFGSGDLSVRTAGADRHEIIMPNVALVGFKIGPIEQLLRERQTVKAP